MDKTLFKINEIDIKIIWSNAYQVRFAASLPGQPDNIVTFDSLWKTALYADLYEQNVMEASKDNIMK